MADPGFATIEGRVIAFSKDAVSFARPLEAAHWIPRSLIHPEDRDGLFKLMAGEVARLRIRAWKAHELGWIGEKDDKTQDLFNGRPMG